MSPSEAEPSENFEDKHKYEPEYIARVYSQSFRQPYAWQEARSVFPEQEAQDCKLL
jgi:hypothetical protein